MVRILSTAFLRPGSERYAAENGSFGIATLRRRHVRVRGNVVHFEFPANAGKLHVSEVRDRRVAQIVARLLALPGREVFAFVDENGATVDVRRSHLNAYLKEAMGRRFLLRLAARGRALRRGRVMDARFDSVERLVASDAATLRRCEKALLALLSGGSLVREPTRRAA